MGEFFEFFSGFDSSSFGSELAGEFESVVNTSVISIEDFLVVVEFLAELVQHGLDGFGSSSTEGVVAAHDGFRVKNALEVFLGSGNLVDVDNVVVASIEVSEVLFVARELSDQASDNVMGFTERNVVFEDQVVGKFSSSGEVLESQISHAVEVEGSRLDKSRDNFNGSVDKAQAFNQDFFVFVEISVVARGKSLHQSESSDEETVDSTSTSTE